MFRFKTSTQTPRQEAQKEGGLSAWVFFFLFKHYKNRKQRRKHLTGGGEGEVGADTPTKARLTTYFIYCLRYACTFGFTQL